MDKLSARERIKRLFDDGSFIEIGTLVNGNGGGVITGYGTMEGKLVYIYSEDYAINGGALDIHNSKKICRVMDLAVQMGAPLIQIYDSTGVKISEGLNVLEAYGEILSRNANISGVIPQFALIAGPCTGMAALSAAMSDFTIMVEDSGELYVNTPEKLIEKQGEYISIKQYADSQNCSKNGSVQINVQDDQQGIDTIKKLITYIPSNNLELALRNINEQSINDIDEELNHMNKDKNWDSMEVITAISDKESVIQLNSSFEKNAVTAFAKINGITVGVIGTNGDIGINEMDKATRMVKLCNCFNIPILSLVNSEGFKVSLEEENKGLLIAAARMAGALSQANVPKISLILGKAYGAVYTILASKNMGFDLSFAWPNAEIALTNPEMILKTYYKEEILNSELPKEKEKEIILEHKEEFTSVYKAAEAGYIDDIILPAETKVRLFSALDMLHTLRKLKYPKKHGSVLV